MSDLNAIEFYIRIEYTLMIYALVILQVFHIFNSEIQANLKPFSCELDVGRNVGGLRGKYS